LRRRAGWAAAGRVVAQGYTIVAPWKKGGDLRARRPGRRPPRDFGQARRALTTGGGRRIL